MDLLARGRHHIQTMGNLKMSKCPTLNHDRHETVASHYAGQQSFGAYGISAEDSTRGRNSQLRRPLALMNAEGVTPSTARNA
jgi:hypothetical protein